MIRISLTLTLFLCFASKLANCTIYYVSPNGDNNNAGTINAPFLTIQRAQTAVVAGDTVYIRGGIYMMQESQIAATSGTNPVFAYVTNLTKSGTATNRIKYWAYPGEQPVFDYTNVKPLNTRINAFEVAGSWIHIKGLEVVGVQVTTAQNINTQSICFSQNSSSSSGGNNIYEQLSMHDGMAVGFYLTRGGNNLVVNCDAYNNWDSISGDRLGGNVDGFGCHPNRETYTGNVFRGCRAWYNSDDGYDCISSYASVTFENCWSWRNGYSITGVSLGNGVGFKAGGYGVSTAPTLTTIPRNIIRFCMAANNKAAGFYANHHLGGNDWYNNTSYRNSINFNLLNRSQDFSQDVPGYGHVLRNNVSYSARSTNGLITDYDAAQCTIDHNTFLNNGITLGAADFISLDTSLIRSPRQADGSLPVINLLRLTSNSDLIDAGIDVGLPYNGIAPDLGAFETSPIILPVEKLLFTASVVNKKAILEWQVASETNNKGWSVERLSALSNAWETIGFVKGKGNSNVKTVYSYTDVTISNGKYLYRLKQLDANGTSKYSAVRSVSLNALTMTTLEVYPIPVQSNTTIRYTLPQKTKVTLQLFNASGHLIADLLNQQNEAGQYQLLLNENLFKTGGTYILKMITDTEMVSKTIIK